MLLTNIWHLPMLWWVIFPWSFVAILVTVLVWEGLKGNVKIKHPDGHF
jgi:hypothetical protein